MLHNNITHKLSLREENLLKHLNNKWNDQYKTSYDICSKEYLTEKQCADKLITFVEARNTGVITYRFEGNEEDISRMILKLFREYHPAGYGTCISRFKYISGIYQVNMYRWSSCD